MKTYKVYAEMVTRFEVLVEAESEAEAFQTARGLDGGDFTECKGSNFNGDWFVLTEGIQVVKK